MCENLDFPTILIVDNDAHGRHFLHTVLSGMGYRTLTAESAEAALNMSIPFHVDLLITDLIMPGMLGAQLSAEFRKKFPAVKQLFISGFPEHAARNFGYLPHQPNLPDQPSAPFLEKPIAIKALREKVRELLATPAEAVSVA